MNNFWALKMTSGEFYNYKMKTYRRGILA